MRFSAVLICLALLSLPAGAFAEIRTYSIEERYGEEIYRALRDVLGERARVSRLPTGQLLIDAQPDLHNQIASSTASI